MADLTRLKIMARDDQIAAKLYEHVDAKERLLGLDPSEWGEDEILAAQYLMSAMWAHILVLTMRIEEHGKRDDGGKRS
jgi:hypothetical protein